jgi:uncharacterized protein (DUF433 family)
MSLAVPATSPRTTLSRLPNNLVGYLAADSIGSQTIHANPVAFTSVSSPFARPCDWLIEQRREANLFPAIAIALAQLTSLPHPSRSRIMNMSSSKEVISSDPEVQGGAVVFTGTRVPVKNLIDYLEAGDSLEEFIEDFPSVKREQAVAALELAKVALVSLAGTH